MTDATEDVPRPPGTSCCEHREDYATAYEGFRWPRPEHFNWALDWFDVIADGQRPHRPAHRRGGRHRDAAAPSPSCRDRSDRVANWLRGRGACAPATGSLVMLGNQAELWETALAAMKLRAVVIPATPLLGPADLRDRVERGRVRHVVVRAADTAKFDEVPGDYTRIAVGGERPTGWLPYEDAYDAAGRLRRRTARPAPTTR